MQLTERIIFTVPSTQGLTQKLDRNAFNKRVNNVIAELSQRYGGATSMQGTGGYMSDAGELVIEQVYNVTAYCTSELLNESEVLELALAYKEAWSQEAIAYEVNGVLYLV